MVLVLVDNPGDEAGILFFSFFAPLKNKVYDLLLICYVTDN